MKQEQKLPFKKQQNKKKKTTQNSESHIWGEQKSISLIWKQRDRSTRLHLKSALN